MAITEIMGPSFGERRERRDVSRACGAGESEKIFGRVLPAIGHQDYRVLVTRGAVDLASSSGRRTPATRDFARAKLAVDRALVDRGLGIKIPGARPGRVTR